MPWLDLVPATDRPFPPIRLRAMEGGNFRINTGRKHLSDAAAQLIGHGGWLCWPTRWKELAAKDPAGTQPAVVVTDSGYVVWGRTREEDWRPRLRTAAVHETDRRLIAVPAPRPSRFVPAAHLPYPLAVAVASLAALPYLLGAAPPAVALLLSAVAGGLPVAAGVGLSARKE